MLYPPTYPEGQYHEHRFILPNRVTDLIGPGYCPPSTWSSFSFSSTDLPATPSEKSQNTRPTTTRKVIVLYTTCTYPITSTMASTTFTMMCLLSLNTSPHRVTVPLMVRYTHTERNTYPPATMDLPVAAVGAKVNRNPIGGGWPTPSPVIGFTLPRIRSWRPGDTPRGSVRPLPKAMAWGVTEASIAPSIGIC